MSNKYEVEILINNKPVRKFAHQSRVFVEARNLQEYGIRIKNNSHEKILAVVSVDGINAISGKASGSDKAGYVIHGYSSYTVPGFRTSNEDTTVFRFNTKSKSYANLSDETEGDTTNCGVIGVQIYAEKEKPQAQIIIQEVEKKVYEPWPIYINPPPYYPKPIWYYCNYGSTSKLGDGNYNSGLQGNYDSSSFQAVNPSYTMRCADNQLSSRNCSSLSPSSLSNQSPVSINFMQVSNNGGTTVADFDMGTEYQGSATDIVQDVEFEVGRLLSTFEIHYASLNCLKNMGVPVTKEAQVSFPKAFPSSFCKPPRRL